MKRRSIVKITLLILSLIVLFSVFVACSDVSTSSNKQSVIYKIPRDPAAEIIEWKVYSGARFAGDALLKFPNEPKIDGYVFAGWYKEETFENEVNEYSYIDVIPASQITLYAKFIKQSEIAEDYTVSFIADDCSIPSIKVKFRDKIQDDLPVPKGYEIVGAYKDAAYTQPWNFEFDRVKENLELYIDIKPINYSIKYPNIKSTEVTTPLQETYNVEQAIVLPSSDSINKPGFYIEEGEYYLDENFETRYDPEKKYYENLTIYVKWSYHTYNLNYNIFDTDIVFNKEDENVPKTFNLQDKINIPQELLPTRVGYTFEGWTYLDEGVEKHLNCANPPAKDLTITPYFSVKKIEIEYILNGGNLNTYGPYYYEYFDETVTLLTPSHEGYDFIGWYKDAGFSEPFDNVNTHEKITVYAKWQLKTYSITYELNGGEVSVANPSNYTILNKNYKNINNPTRSGYKFIRWYLDAEFTQEFDKEQEYAKDLVLHARWAQNELVNPDNYQIYANTSTIFVDSDSNKNIAISLNTDDYVVYSSLDQNDYTSLVNETGNLFIVKFAYLKDNYNNGEKISCRVVFKSGKQKYYYFTLTKPFTVSIEANDFVKGEASDFIIQTNGATNVNAINIDEKLIPEFSFENNTITIPKKYLSNLSASKHVCQVFANGEIVSDTFTITNSALNYPYNVKIDIDSSFPNVYVTWDCDAKVNEFKVTILGQTYTTTENKFDATNILKIKDTKCIVKAVIGDEEYAAEEVSMPYSLFASSSSSTMLTKANSIFGYPSANGFEFYGKKNNFYITSWKELSDLLFFTLMYPEKITEQSRSYKDEDGIVREGMFHCYDYLLDFDVTQSGIDLTGSPTVANGNYLDDPIFVVWLLNYTISTLPEAASYAFLSFEKDFGFTQFGAFEMAMQVRSAPKNPTTVRNEELNINQNYTQAKYSVKHYGNGIIDDNYKFPRELNNKGEVTVNTSIELYLALESGYLPKVESSNTQLNLMYRRMKSYLRSIIDEDMTEVEIAIAIYDFLEKNVIYDYELLEYEQSLSPDSEEYSELRGISSFYMEGVFNYNYAVCNGIAAAYTSMLNLMGIESYKLSGSTTSGAHAWVKMKIGGLWYISDPTWSNALAYKNLINSSDGSIEMISYKHFMIPYDVSYEQGRIKTNNSPNEAGYEGDYAFDVYRNLKFEYDGTVYDHVMDTELEGRRMIAALINKFGSQLQANEYIIISVKIYDIANYRDYLYSSNTEYEVRSLEPDGNIVTVFLKKK